MLDTIEIAVARVDRAMLTAAVRDECAALGFDLFQGYFFARPETIGGRDIPVPMRELVERVSLTPELKEALLARRGPFGATPRIAEAYEGARWPEVRSQAEWLHASPDELPRLYPRAVEWACEVELGSLSLVARLDS